MKTTNVKRIGEKLTIDKQRRVPRLGYRRSDPKTKYAKPTLDRCCFSKKETIYIDKWLKEHEGRKLKRFY
ncbi:MAG: hypothetical protein CMI54_03525 [Parcubacteria group bacterium]|jgi:hypothetical protein|nr:hypothetical protein [Parcubacteria group bacterium]|tara:strand:- start:3962 stop:4171 length:210 start_codon:yes stop_codon:yes gene_type:complete